MSGFNDHIVYVCLHCFADLCFQACLNHALIGCTGVLKPERHGVKTEGVVWGDKCRCGLIGLRHLDLMVSGVSIEETQRVVSCGSIDGLIDVGEEEGILRASLIEVLWNIQL